MPYVHEDMLSVLSRYGVDRTSIKTDLLEAVVDPIVRLAGTDQSWPEFAYWVGAMQYIAMANLPQPNSFLFELRGQMLDLCGSYSDEVLRHHFGHCLYERGDSDQLRVTELNFSGNQVPALYWKRFAGCLLDILCDHNWNLQFAMVGVLQTETGANKEHVLRILAREGVTMTTANAWFFAALVHENMDYLVEEIKKPVDNAAFEKIYEETINLVAAVVGSFSREQLIEYLESHPDFKAQFEAEAKLGVGQGMMYMRKHVVNIASEFI